jgi:hypothetical protein
MEISWTEGRRFTGETDGLGWIVAEGSLALHKNIGGSSSTIIGSSSADSGEGDKTWGSIPFSSSFGS